MKFDLESILKRRKVSPERFLEGENVQTVEQLNSWIAAHSDEYAITDDFLQILTTSVSINSEVVTAVAVEEESVQQGTTVDEQQQVTSEVITTSTTTEVATEETKKETSRKRSSN